MSTSRPLPPGGPERQAFVVGLRLMSAQCVMPKLTPDCPFYEITSQGAACGEQCIDLLAAHREPEHGGQTIGDGLSAFRRPEPRHRPRRSPDPMGRPFDALGLHMRDRDRPVEQRATATLIKDLGDNLSIPPSMVSDPRERAHVLRASMSELARRGIDADELVRCGFGNRVAAGVTVAMMAKDIIGEQKQLEPIFDALPDPDPAWLACLEAGRSADGLEHVPMIDYTIRGPGRRRITHWIRSADMDGVLDWVAPTPDVFTNVAEDHWTWDQRTLNTWLVDRFTQTYLDNWDDDSLVMEWDYLHGGQEGCCPSSVMAERKTDAEEVNGLLAQMHSRDRKANRGDLVERLAPDDFTRAAAEHVAAGRHETAAAIFAAVLRASPPRAPGWT